MLSMVLLKKMVEEALKALFYAKDYVEKYSIILHQ